MSVSRELKRRVGCYEPCLPRLAKEPSAGPGWFHEIKHDSFRIPGRKSLITEDYARAHRHTIVQIHDVIVHQADTAGIH